MAETERKHLGQLRADNPSPGGVIPPDAIIHWAKALTAGQPQNGVNSYGGTFAEILQFLASNMATIEVSPDGRMSARIRIGASGGLQLAMNPNVRLERNSNSTMVTPTIPQNEWLHPFQVSVPTLGILPASSNSWDGITWNENTKDLAGGARTAYAALTLFRTGGPNFPAGSSVENVIAFAFGPWA